MTLLSSAGGLLIAIAAATICLSLPQLSEKNIPCGCTRTHCNPTCQPRTLPQGCWPRPRSLSPQPLASAPPLPHSAAYARPCCLPPPRPRPPPLHPPARSPHPAQSPPLAHRHPSPSPSPCPRQHRRSRGRGGGTASWSRPSPHLQHLPPRWRCGRWCWGRGLPRGLAAPRRREQPLGFRSGFRSGFKSRFRSRFRLEFKSGFRVGGYWGVGRGRPKKDTLGSNQSKSEKE